MTFNANYTEGRVGWATPVATDTAFVLAIISLVGFAIIPNSVKIFVIGLSIIDDVLAVLVLAIFYTPNLHFIWILLSLVPIIFLLLLNIYKVSKQYIYYTLGIVLWFCIVKSGVHGTISGILLAILIPVEVEIGGENVQLVKKWKHRFIR